MLRVIALVVGAALVTSPSVAMSRSAPAPKSVPSSVLLEYYSRAPGAGRLVVRSSGAAKVVHLRHRARTFRLGTGELSRVSGTGTNTAVTAEDNPSAADATGRPQRGEMPQTTSKPHDATRPHDKTKP